MKKILCFVIGIIFVLMIPWTTSPSAQENMPTKTKLGFWSIKDEVWIYSPRAFDSSKTSSTIYIPLENALTISRQVGKPSLVFRDNNQEVKLISLSNITTEPTETEMWRKLLIKAKLGGYPYLYDFIIELFCYTGGESVPLAMNDVYNDIMSAFAYYGQFPTSSRGVWYCLQEYTQLKRAGKVPINDPAGEVKLIKFGRQHFRLPLIPRSLFSRT